MTARKRPPKCPDCGSRHADAISSDAPGDAAWRCSDCAAQYGERESPRKPVPKRSVNEWFALVKTMLPEPVNLLDGICWGGEPPVVGVSIDGEQIAIVEATFAWPHPHESMLTPAPFATRPLTSPAIEVARLIIAARAKRLGRYRWCPRCRELVIPEYMNAGNVCDGCATTHLGVVF